MPLYLFQYIEEGRGVPKFVRILWKTMDRLYNLPTHQWFASAFAAQDPRVWRRPSCVSLLFRVSIVWCWTVKCPVVTEEELRMSLTLRHFFRKMSYFVDYQTWSFLRLCLIFSASIINPHISLIPVSIGNCVLFEDRRVDAVDGLCQAIAAARYRATE